MKLKAVLFAFFAVAALSVSPAAFADGCPLCEVADLETVNRLLDEGANPNAYKSFKSFGELVQKTALMVAAQNGSAEIVNALLSAGANPNTVREMTRYGHKITTGPALKFAVENGHAEVVEVLLSAGARIHRGYSSLAEDRWSNTQTQEKAKEYREVVRLLNQGKNESGKDELSLWDNIILLLEE